MRPEASRLRNGLVCFEPLGKLLSAELPGRDLTDRFDHLCFLRVQTVAVLEQKRPGREQSHSLVAVGKGMVLAETLSAIFTDREVPTTALTDL